MISSIQAAATAPRAASPRPAPPGVVPRNARARVAGTRLALCGLALLGASGCKSADEHRRDADEEVYRLVLDRREELALGESSFTLEPDPGSLRQRALRGEAEDLGSLSVVECLEIGAENSRDYQTRKERLYLAALDLTLERWRFSFRESGSAAAFLDGTGDEAESASFDGGFSLTRLFGSGAAVVGSIGLGLARSLVSSDGWDAASDVGLAVTQPLLRGFGARIVQEPLTQAERDLVYEVRAFERFRRTFAIDVASRYYRLLQLQDTLANQEFNFENLTRLTARNEELARAGRLSDLEFGQARQNELRSRVQLLEAVERLAEQRDAFKLFLGLPIAFEIALDPAALAELEAEDLSAFGFGADEAVRFALAHRLDHQTALDQVDDTARRIVVAADELRTGLDLVADAGLVSPEGKPLDLDPSDAGWSLGLDLDLPLDRLPERNAYRRALIVHEAARRSAEESGDEIEADLRSELREAETRREGYEIQLAAVELAEARIDSTRLKLEAGRADTRDLLEAEESLLDARNGATEALIDYTLARLQLFRDMELLRVGEGGLEVDTAALAGAETEPGAPSEAAPAEPEEARP